MIPQILKLSQIVPGQNPRSYFDPVKMAELVASVREKGVITPLLVRPFNDMFQVVAGGRRYRAATEANLEEVPVLVKELTDAEAKELALIENVQRDDMNPAEEAAAAADILGNCDGDRDEAARRLGWTREVLEKRLALMNAVQEVRDALIDRKIKLGHAELIAALAKEKQPAILTAILSAEKMPSVPELKGQIASHACDLGVAIFEKTECAGCVHNSGNQGALFAEAIQAGYCTNRDCYTAKIERALEGIRDSLKDDYPEVRFVRPGDNASVLKLRATGNGGVGEQQAQACRGCGKFGAAVSAIPGHVGKKFKDLCFDPICNAEKVKAQQKEEAEAQAAIAAEATKSKAGDTTTTPAAKASGPGKAAAGSTKVVKPTSVQDSTRVKEYRVKVWRSALGKHLVTHPEQNEVALLAIALTDNGRHIAGSKMREVFGKLTGKPIATMKPSQAMDELTAAGGSVMSNLRLVVAASVAEGIEEQKVVELLMHLQVDLSATWQLNDEYLSLLTKSEIEVVAEQCGIKAHIAKDFPKVMQSKKPEIVKALLAIKDFPYKGKIPSNMKFSAK